MKNRFFTFPLGVFFSIVFSGFVSVAAEYSDEAKGEIEALIRSTMTSVMTEVKASHQEGTLGENAQKIVQSHLSPQMDFVYLSRYLMGARKFKKIFDGKDSEKEAYIQAVQGKVEKIFASVISELEDPQSINVSSAEVVFNLQYANVNFDNNTFKFILKKNKDSGKWAVRRFNFSVGGTPIDPLQSLKQRVKTLASKHKKDPEKIISGVEKGAKDRNPDSMEPHMDEHVGVWQKIKNFFSNLFSW